MTNLSMAKNLNKKDTSVDNNCFSLLKTVIDSTKSQGNINLLKKEKKINYSLMFMTTNRVKVISISCPLMTQAITNRHN